MTEPNSKIFQAPKIFFPKKIMTGRFETSEARSQHPAEAANELPSQLRLVPFDSHTIGLMWL